MRFVILGAGAVGGYVGARLAEGGERVFLIARGAHLEAIRDRGLEVVGEKPFRGPVPAGERAEAGSADVLIVAVKSYDTRSAAEACRDALAPGGFVVSLQNGLGNVEALSEVFGEARVVTGVVRVGTEVVRPGVIRHGTSARVIVGERDGRPSERLARFRERLEGAGLPCEVTPDIRQAVWEKLLANAIFNVLAASEGCELGDLRTGERRAKTERAIAEFLAVAKATGVTVRPEAVANCWTYCDVHPKAQTSTQQDLARGRNTEWEALSASVVEAGRAVGVATPTHEAMAKKLREVTESGRKR
jgi:2-dehydropantoate 2-reductase